ncbi:hypothetical protein [Actinomadura harenae]|uniref:Uncharacterized protein n=1 Tax=Actinomadura harenae TaxID=2483351 RepID=A0A3M2M0Q2_9ACTN|nr:hypothetical protein [Actinomadura harenae]RMI40668.1 hypothetical protein EBO15_25725 [Actinomadura harenae]
MSIRGPVIFQAGTVPHDGVPQDAVRAAAGRIVARYPQVITWYGKSTGHWWAMVGDRLLEAGTPWELEAAIHQATVAAVPRTDGWGEICGCGCMREDVRHGLLGRLAGLLHPSNGGRDAA